MDKGFKKFIVFWLSQSLSMLGSAMTGYALTLWVYDANRNAMSLSLMIFCSQLPRILVSIFAGGYIDSHKKKNIILAADSVAAAGTIAICLLSFTGRLKLWHICAANILSGAMNAFQFPASSIATRMMVPEEKLGNVSGMESFASNLITLFTPALAASVYTFAGLTTVLLIDILSFAVAFTVLAFGISIPGDEAVTKDNTGIFTGYKEGYAYIKNSEIMRNVVFTLALINLFSNLTYENILPSMILARSDNDTAALGIVNTVIGAAGILGGLIMSLSRKKWDRIKLVYIGCFLSFLLGDLVMAFGKSTIAWSLGGAGANFFIPFIIAGLNLCLYTEVPDELQGRVMTVRNSIQYISIPVGIILGGYLADYVFEPFMSSGSSIAAFLTRLVGSGAGSGMAVMFIITGTLGSLFSICTYFRLKNHINT